MLQVLIAEVLIGSVSVCGGAHWETLPLSTSTNGLLHPYEKISISLLNGTLLSRAIL